MSVFKRYKYWVNSAKYTTVQKFVILIIGIISFMLLARMLGPDGYGEWGVFVIFATITETIRNSLIRNAFIWFSKQTDAGEHGRLQAAAFLINCLLSVFLSLVYFISSEFIGSILNAPTMAGMLRIYSLCLIITIFFSHIETVLNAKMNFRGICWMNCIRQVFFLSGVIFFYFLELHVSTINLAFLYVGAVVVGSITGFILSSKYLWLEFEGYKCWVSKLWKFGRFVFGTNIFSQLFRSTDVIITSIFFGPGVSAFYNASQRISNLVDMPSAVLADIMFPKVAQFSSSDKRAVKNIYEKSVGATMMFSIPALIIILIFPGMILRFLAGSQFVEAAPILRIIAFFGFVLPFIKQFGTVIDGTGSPQINFRVMLFGFVINIIIIVIFTNIWGVIGTALGTATTYFILFVISQFILYRKFGIKITGVSRQIRILYVEMTHTLKTIIK